MPQRREHLEVTLVGAPNTVAQCSSRSRTRGVWHILAAVGALVWVGCGDGGTTEQPTLGALSVNVTPASAMVIGVGFTSRCSVGGA